MHVSCIAAIWATIFTSLKLKSLEHLGFSPGGVQLGHEETLNALFAREACIKIIRVGDGFVTDMLAFLHNFASFMISENYYEYVYTCISCFGQAWCMPCIHLGQMSIRVLSQNSRMERISGPGAPG